MILYKIKPGIFERTVPVFSNLPINLANVLSGPQQCCDKDEVDFTNAIANNYLYLFPLEFHQNNNLWWLQVAHPIWLFLNRCLQLM